jgi:translation elongation factor EF-Tu-like GTPase
MDAPFVFRDMLHPSRGAPIRIRARISVLRTEDGGRKVPFTHHYRPNHNFGGAEDRVFYIGQVEVPEGEWVHPGETRDLPITFINAGDLPELIKIGRTWRIQEGGHHVADAEVLEILKT